MLASISRVSLIGRERSVLLRPERRRHDSCSTTLLALPEARRRRVRPQACDGAKVDMERRAAKRCQAWNSSERIADVPHPPHHWPMGAIFSPVAASASSADATIVRAMTCSLSSLFLPHRFLTRVATLALFFSKETSKEYLS